MKKNWFLIVFSCFIGSAHAMTAMSNEEMDEIIGQALIVAETIQGSTAVTYASGFTFTRMGLDARLSLNANIDKLQLGCGGFNESIVSNACDIDMDYVSFLGRSGTNAGAVDSDFVLTRPYIEIATKGSGATREVVGFKIGAQTVDGYLGVGRVYAPGATNQEHGGTCSGTQGTNALNCHSGINRVSGYLNVDMAVKLDVSIIGSTSEACFGQLPGSACASNAKVYRQFTGTRMNSVYAENLQLTLTGGIGGLIGSGYARIDESMRFVHGFAFESTSDFFLSLQRERVAWPTYAKNTYSNAANAGWWMNVPDVKLVAPNAASTSISLLNVFSALNPPGYLVTNIDLGQTPPKNCWGTTTFC